MAQIIHPIIIIGAGPAGLSAAFELKQRNLDFLLLEAGNGAGHSWHHMPSFLRMVSTGAANTLGRDDRTLTPYSLKRMPASEYAAYLQDFCLRQQFQVCYQTKVERVDRQQNGLFLLHTTRGVFHARAVINTTGHIATPVIPDVFKGAPAVHFQHSRDLTWVPDGARVLIVGKRMSAGQLLDELVMRGTMNVELSARSTITYSKGHPWDKLLFGALLLLERILMLSGLDPEIIDVKMMDGPGVALLRQGKIAVRPVPVKIEDRHVTFSDGQQTEYDVILLATGYEYGARHLPLDSSRPLREQLERDGFSVRGIPGLFLLGLESQINYRSRFIRGMREDARDLASLIASQQTISN